MIQSPFFSFFLFILHSSLIWISFNQCGLLLRNYDVISLSNTTTRHKQTHILCSESNYNGFYVNDYVYVCTDFVPIRGHMRFKSSTHFNILALAHHISYPRRKKCPNIIHVRVLFHCCNNTWSLLLFRARSCVYVGSRVLLWRNITLNALEVIKYYSNTGTKYFFCCFQCFFPSIVCHLAINKNNMPKLGKNTHSAESIQTEMTHWNEFKLSLFEFIHGKWKRLFWYPFSAKQQQEQENEKEKIDSVCKRNLFVVVFFTFVLLTIWLVFFFIHGSYHTWYLIVYSAMRV